MMLVLDTGFRALSERSLRELLDSQMVALIAAAEPQPSGGYAPAPHTLDPRLATPRSGLYAEIHSQRYLWRSPSTAGLSTSDFGALLVPGERNLVYAAFGHDRVAIESRAIQFADDPNGKRTITFSVAVSLSPYEEQLWRFRHTLGNLAHSLKTPLAVMRASLSSGTPAGPVGAEIDRMSGIIEHQLKRAAASGGALLGQAPVEVAQVASELRGTLLKVYAG